MNVLCKLKWVNFQTIWLIVFLLLATSCKKLIEVSPPTTLISSSSAYNEDQTAVAVLTGLYISISNVTQLLPDPSGLLSISRYGGLSSDEFNIYSGATDKTKAYYTNELISNSTLSHGGEEWKSLYILLLTCNSAIEGLSASNTLTPFVKQQLLGEAEFMRAFIYFYLVNLYGDVPLVTGTDYEKNRLLPRSSKVDVYKFIVGDLSDAQTKLSDKYLDVKLNPYNTSPERTRPTKWAANALLARVHLYTNDYLKAVTEASADINQTALFGLVPLPDVFLKNSKEAIFQLQPVIVNWNTEDARLFILNASPAGFSSTKPFYLDSSLLAAFETGDNRKISWIGAYTNTNGMTYQFPHKYKSATSGAPLTEYVMVLRIGEQYLIRAEARAQQGDISGSLDDLNAIRRRARIIPTAAIPDPLPDLQVSLSKEQILAAILQERRVELFSEWGHRWFDLKRTGNIDSVMRKATSLKGGIWQTTDQYYPIPFSDIQTDVNLIQNEGYK